jgi:hypothetical protein
MGEKKQKKKTKIYKKKKGVLHPPRRIMLAWLNFYTFGYFRNMLHFAVKRSTIFFSTEMI